MIELRHLGVRFGERQALRDVSLSLARGDILGLIGPPESGKTVLLKAIAMLVDVSAGQLWCDGAQLSGGGGRAADAAAAWRRRIGMSFQNDALFDSQSVFDNVAYPLRRRHVVESEVNVLVTARLREVGLAAAAALDPSALSGGMRKRVGIARATVAKPELGLFDEPVAGLDPVTGGRILDLIVTLTRTLGMATVIVSNDLPVLLPVCNEVMMLHEGAVVYVGSPRGLFTSPRAEVVQFATGADEGPL